MIEEVDEQLTLTSLKPESRPHVQNIFAQGPSQRSDPVDVPSTKQSLNGEIFSRSAPVPKGVPFTVSDNTVPGNLSQRRRSGPRLII